MSLYVLIHPPFTLSGVNLKILIHSSKNSGLSLPTPDCSFTYSGSNTKVVICNYTEINRGFREYLLLYG